MKRCAQCILPESYPGIIFNEKGICNYCNTYKRNEYAGEDELKNKLDPYRNKNGKYDCLVGISGGRDSTYLLWYAVKVLRLRVLALFVDNGVATETAKLNVKNAADILNIDLVIKKNDFIKKCIKHTIQNWMRKPSIGMIALMCAGCEYGIRLEFIQTAKENQISLLFIGIGEPTKSFANRFLSINPHGKITKFSLIVGFLLEIIKNPSYLKYPSCLMTYTKEYIARWSPLLRKRIMKKLVYPRNLKMICPFWFIKWDEKEIISVITNQLKWKKYSGSESTWKSDCKLAILKNYLYKEMVGFTKMDDLLSNMIRENMITREEGLKRLKNESIISQQFIIDFFDELGLSFSDLNIALRRASKNKQKKKICRS